MSRRSKKNRNKWLPGRYEGLTPEQVRSQVGTNVPKCPEGFSSEGLTQFVRGSGHHGKGCMK